MSVNHVLTPLTFKLRQMEIAYLDAQMETGQLTMYVVHAQTIA